MQCWCESRLREDEGRELTKPFFSPSTSSAACATLGNSQRRVHTLWSNRCSINARLLRPSFCSIPDENAQLVFSESTDLCSLSRRRKVVFFFVDACVVVILRTVLRVLSEIASYDRPGRLAGVWFLIALITLSHTFGACK